MKTHHILIGLLIAASICADLLIVSIAHRQGIGDPTSSPSTVMLAANALALGQIVLVGVWTVWGRSKLPIRILLASGGIWGISRWIHAVDAVPDLRLAMIRHAAFFGIVVSAFATAQRFGVRLISETARSRNPQSAATAAPWQYTLAQLLSWMTAIAIVLGVMLRIWDPKLDAGRLFMQVLPFSLVAIVAFFAAFQRQTPLSVALLLFATPLVAAVPTWLEGKWAFGFWQARLFVSAGLTIYVVGAVSVLRAGAWRLRGNVSRAPEPQAAVTESTAPALVPFRARGAP